MSKSVRGTAGILITAFLAAPLAAQPSAYRLGPLLDSARKHLPILMAKRAAVNSAKAGVDDARHAALPQILIGDQINLSTLNAVEGSFFPLGAMPSTTSGVRPAGKSDLATGDLAVVYSQMELLNFGLNGARVDNAEARLGLGRADLDRERYLADADVAHLFLGLARAESRLGVEQQNASRYEEVFRIQRALTASGIRAGVDSSLAKAELSRARSTVTQAQGTIAQLKVQLAAITGIAPEALDVDTTALVFAPAVEDSATKPAASLRHPLLDYYVQQQQLRRSDQRLAGKTYMPKVLVGGGAWARGSSISSDDVYGALGSGFGLQRFNYGMAIAVSYDVVGMLHRSDKMAISQGLAEAAGFELQQQQLNLRTAASRADEAIRTAESNLAEFPIQLGAAQDTYAQKVAQYQAGLINLIDLTNAAFVLYRSQHDYIGAVNDWYVARLEKAIASGTLESFVRSLK